MKQQIKNIFRRFDGDKCKRIALSDIDFKGDPGKTQPHHEDEVNINSIVDRWSRTGELPNVNIPMWGDMLQRAPKSLQEANERLIQARQQFLALPSAVRAEADNNPVIFFDRWTKKDPRLIQAMIDYKLLTVTGEVQNNAQQKPVEAAPAEKPKS